MRKVIVLTLFLSLGLIPLHPGFAQEEPPKAKCLEAVEFFTGFSLGKLHGQKNYEVIPFIVDFDFDLKPLLAKLNIRPKALLQFQIEPNLAVISSPHANMETGVAFALKAGLLPQTSKIQPYLKVALGLDYMTLHTHEQGTQFNFIEYGGVGAHYFFKKNTAFTIEGRFRHLSNSGIKDPNKGINAYFVLAGITQQF